MLTNVVRIDTVAIRRLQFVLIKTAAIHANVLLATKELEAYALVKFQDILWFLPEIYGFINYWSLITTNGFRYSF